MGFPREKAIQALKNNDDVQAAIDWVLSGGGDDTGGSDSPGIQSTGSGGGNNTHGAVNVDQPSWNDDEGAYRGTVPYSPQKVSCV